MASLMQKITGKFRGTPEVATASASASSAGAAAAERNDEDEPGEVEHDEKEGEGKDVSTADAAGENAAASAAPPASKRQKNKESIGALLRRSNGGVTVHQEKTKKFILVGLVGSGKSSVARILQEGLNEQWLNPDEGVSASARSRTKEVKAKTNLKVKRGPDTVTMDVYDTPGFGDPRMPFAEILHSLVDDFSTTISEIDRIVFCFKYDRLRAELARELRLCYDFFRKVGAEDHHFLVCVTFAEYARHEQVDDFMNELATMPDFDFLGKLHMIHSGFPDMSQLKEDENLQQFIVTVLTENYAALLNELVWQQLDRAPFRPMQSLLSMTSQSFDGLKKELLKHDQSSPFGTSFFLQGPGDAKQLNYADVVESLEKRRAAFITTGSHKKKKQQAARTEQDVKMDKQVADRKRKAGQ